jgi:hypothetical protein
MINKERIKQRAKLIRPLLVPLILYIGLLAVSVSWVPKNETSPWRYLVAILPMFPGAFIVFGIMRAVRQLDEMERRILLEAAAFGFAFTLFWLLSQGLLGLAGVPQPSGIIIAAVMSFTLVMGKIIGNWRYK